MSTTNECEIDVDMHKGMRQWFMNDNLRISQSLWSMTVSSTAVSGNNIAGLGTRLQRQEVPSPALPSPPPAAHNKGLSLALHVVVPLRGCQVPQAPAATDIALQPMSHRTACQEADVQTLLDKPPMQQPVKGHPMLVLTHDSVPSSHAPRHTRGTACQQPGNRLSPHLKYCWATPECGIVHGMVPATELRHQSRLCTLLSSTSECGPCNAAA